MHEKGKWHDAWITFERVKTGLFEAPLWEQSYDVVLFDAFAPGAQPELWTVQSMDRMRLALKPGGQLVTYCAKGDVRRAMTDAGFSVERLPGPPWQARNVAGLQGPQPARTVQRQGVHGGHATRS